jgi:hypothetical protein
VEARALAVGSRDPTLACQRETLPLDGELEVLGLDARELCRQHEAFGVLVEIDGREHAGARSDAGRGTGKEVVHFAAETLESVPRPAVRRPDERRRELEPGHRIPPSSAVSTHRRSCRKR